MDLFRKEGGISYHNKKTSFWMALDANLDAIKALPFKNES